MNNVDVSEVTETDDHIPDLPNIREKYNLPKKIKLSSARNLTLAGRYSDVPRDERVYTEIVFSNP